MNSEEFDFKMSKTATFIQPKDFYKVDEKKNKKNAKSEPDILEKRVHEAEELSKRLGKTYILRQIHGGA